MPTVSLTGFFNLQVVYVNAGTGLTVPAASYRLYTYAPSTTTHKVAYTDSAGTTAHTYTSDGSGGNYIALNARGELPAPLFLQSGGYDIELKSDAGASIWTRRSAGQNDNSNTLDTALRADLASAADVAKGAALVGLLPTLAYAANTVGAFARQLNPLRKYGTLNNNGSTNDSTTWQAAAASGDKFIDARGLNCRIDAAISIPSGQVWLLEGTSIVMASSTQTVFDCVTVNDWALLGPLKITGDGSTIGTAKAIRVSDCSRWLVDAPTISSMRGWGIYIEPGSSTTARGTHGTIRDAVLYSNYYGYEDLPGTGAEYCTLVNPRIYLNTAHGLKTAAGNTSVIGGHIVDNAAIGVHLVAGSNHGHGICSGVNINHNGTYGIKAEQCVNGFTFAGCHIYQNDIWFDRSKGIHIQGGILDPTNIYNYFDGSSGLNFIEGCWCPGGYGPRRTIGSTDGHYQLIIRNCTGPGSYATASGKDATGITINDPATAWVQTTRDAAASQSLTSGVAATMTWSTAPYVFDRRLMQSAGTFTIPADQAGLYRVTVDALFSGTAMSSTASIIEMKIGGTAKKIMFPSINSTTTLQIAGSFDYYFNASDAVTLVATITGTTPTFGHATYPSNATIARIG